MTVVGHRPLSQARHLILRVGAGFLKGDLGAFYAWPPQFVLVTTDLLRCNGTRSLTQFATNDSLGTADHEACPAAPALPNILARGVLVPALCRSTDQAKFNLVPQLWCKRSLLYRGILRMVRVAQ